MKTVISSKKAPAAIGPYSQAISVGEIIYTSGVVPLDPATGAVVEGDAAVQARRVFESLKGLLEDAGSSMENVVKTTVFIKNMEDFAKINEVYAEFFPEPFPARSCVEVARLPKDVLLETEVIALKK